jgi:RNA polymerase sigma factor (TIGR02999 family)
VTQVTQLLQSLHQGDGDAMQVVIPLVYEELRKLARAHLRREGSAARLHTTTLVHEAFLRLSAGSHPSYENRAHFYGIASRVMRQVLVDSARARSARKRGAGIEVAMASLPQWAPTPDRALLAMDDALARLEQTDPIKSRLIEMRYFCGMTADESSVALSMPVHAVRRDLRLAHAWLRRELSAEASV